MTQKYFNNITVSLFTNAEEEGEMKKLISSLIPFDLKENKIKIEKSVATGFDDKKIIILSLTLKRNKNTKEFFHHILESISPGNREVLTNQLNSRIDGNCDFFLRFDKDALKKGNLLLTDSGKCVHIKCSVAVFPKKKDAAVELVKDCFKSE